MTKSKLQPLERIGKYEVVRLIRSTGNSDLYLCHDLDLEAKIVIKVFAAKDRLLEALPYTRENWRTRFINEARLLGQIDHPNVISVREMLWLESEPCYVMPWVETSLLNEMGKDAEGESGAYPPELDDIPYSKKLSINRSIDLLSQIAAGLKAFHDLGLVHRDIKPGNILISQVNTGDVKICDPGLVKFPDNDESLGDYWFGTRDYISPEQLGCEPEIDRRADFFSLGVIGYRMLSGKLPVGVFPGLDEEVNDIPAALNDLIMACLSNDKNMRPDDTDRTLEQLELAKASL